MAAAGNDSILNVDDVSVRFETAEGPVVAVDRVSFAVQPSEFLSIIGPSGCGKSTVFNVIGGLLTNHIGKVTVAGELIDGPHKSIGMVFQEESTFPWRTVADNVAFPLELVGMPRAKRMERAQTFIKMVGLDGFEKRYPGIRLELLMSDQPGDLNGEGIDCAIRVGQLEDSSHIAHKIGYLRNVVLASPEYLERHGAPTSIDDLKQHRCINYVYPNGKPRQWQFDVPGGQIEVDVDAHLLINDGESVIQAVSEGLGITQAPHLLASCLLSKGMLQLVMTDVRSTGKPVWIVYPQKRHLSARVRAFIGWVRELFDRTNQPGHCAVGAQKIVSKLQPAREETRAEVA